MAIICFLNAAMLVLVSCLALMENEIAYAVCLVLGAWSWAKIALDLTDF